jgi:glucose/arabinose dehydrogenase
LVFQKYYQNSVKKELYVKIHRMKKILTLSLLLLVEFSNAQSLTLEPFSTGYNWLIGFEHPPGDDRLFVFQKDGHLRICNTDGSIKPQDFLDLSAKVNNSWNNEQGLVGVAFHPDYQATGWFYVFYNQLNTGDCTISRFSRSASNPNLADPNSEVVLLTWPHPRPNHVGGCLKFGPDGYLYIATGDGGGAGDPDGNGQNLQTLLGKVLRINVNGSFPYNIPTGNPFVNDPNARPEIWAYGLRNPWRFSFDRQGWLWLTDVGQDQREEINLVRNVAGQGGLNFGWSCREGSLPFNSSQCIPNTIFEQPFFEYNHDAGNCSVSGGARYGGSMYGDLFDQYIFTDFCTGKIWMLPPNDPPQWVQLGDFQNNDLTMIDANASGELFASGFFTNTIYRLKSNDCAPVARILQASPYTLTGNGDLLTLYGSAMNYHWFLDGVEIAGATGNSLNISQPGIYTAIVTNAANGCSAASNAVEVVAATGSVVIEGDLFSCETNLATFSVAPVAGATYQWQVSTGTILSGNGTPEITVQWQGPGMGIGSSTISLGMSLPNGDLLAGALQVTLYANDLFLTTDYYGPTCPGGSDGFIFPLYTGSGIPSHQWSNGSTALMLDSLPAGTYTLTVFGMYGCTLTETYVLNDPPASQVNLEVENVTCTALGAVSGMASNPPCGVWAIGEMSNLPAGNYTVTVTDCNGCVSLHEATVEDESVALILTAVITDPSAGQSDGSIELNAEGGTPPYTISGCPTADCDNLPAGTYEITVTDSKGCTGSITVQLIGGLAAEETGGGNIFVFPNPAKSGFYVDFQGINSVRWQAGIFDLLGKPVAVYDEKTIASVPSKRWFVDASAWHAGVYFLYFRSGNETGIFQKLVKS